MWIKKIRVAGNSQPAITEHGIIAGAGDNNIYFFDKETGDEKWKFQTEGGIETSPKISLQNVYVGSNDRHLYALDIETGKLQFKFPAGNSIKSSPAISDEIAVFGSWDRNVYAVNANNGELLWKYPTGDWVQVDAKTDHENVYIACMDRIIYALDLKTGALKWMHACYERAEKEIQIADDKLLFTNGRYNFSILNKDTGDLLLEYRSNNEIKMLPILYDGVVIVGDAESAIMTIDISSGKIVNHIKHGAVLTGSAGLAKGRGNSEIILASGANNKLYAINKNSLRNEAVFQLPFPISSKPVKTGNSLMIVSEDGTLQYIKDFFKDSEIDEFSIKPDENKPGSIPLSGGYFGADNMRQPQKKSAAQRTTSATEMNSAQAQNQNSANAFFENKSQLLQSGFNPVKSPLSSPELVPIVPAIKTKPPGGRKIISPLEDAVQKLKTAVNNLSGKITEKPYGFSASIKGQSGADKDILILTKGKDYEGDSYLQMLVPLSIVDIKKTPVYLRENALLAYGSLALAKINSMETIVLSETQLAESADIPELQSMLKSLALKGEDLQNANSTEIKKSFVHSAAPMLQAGKALLQQTSKYLQFEYTEGEKGFEIIITRNNKRAKINMLLDKVDSDNNYMITLIALCGVIQDIQKASINLLRYNIKTPYGGYGAVKNQGQVLAVYTDTRILTHTQPVEIHKSLISIHQAVEYYNSASQEIQK